MSARVVSRLYTDYYFPTISSQLSGSVGGRDNPYGECTELQDDGISVKADSATPPSSPDVDYGRAAKKPAQGSSGFKRIFIARIPSSVTEDDLRKYFEQFGTIEDAYRPRDFTKNTYRGIGFVTFAEASAVDRVIAMKHVLGGVEVIADRATPKEPSSTKSDASRWAPKQQKNVASMDDTVGSLPSESLANNCLTPPLRGSYNEQTFDLTIFNSIPKMSTTPYPNSNGNNCGPPSTFSDDFLTEVAPATTQSSIFAADVYTENTTSHRTAKTNTSRAKTSLAETSIGKVAKTGGNGSLPAASSPTTLTTGGAVTRAERIQKQSVTDNFAHVRKVRGGSRIFVGKISKATCEQELADYFSQFGFVTDVYIPRSRENKKEHRGFGFVTFETEASIKRTISQGTHNLKGVVLAIDVAVPENSSGN